ncbi:S8 family serine peptidase [Actinophytocola sp. NPDC049390]|uniref:S8 family serine peptidase n=1 Tax=Actinophytocola sp. NPDC049390 TaxID=3363894 RepID=UPI0037B8448E
MWPLTTGVGQTVAVLGTGVDSGNPQLDRVLPGATDDCDGRGTFAAGIVAGRPDPATTFTGMAPGARILPGKYTETTGNGGAPDPDRLASAISGAVDGGATVVLVVVPTMRDSPALVRAVREAVARDVVVVSPAVGDKASARSYPTSLPGVLGVGVVDEGGGAVQGEAGEHIAVSAPGKDVVGTSARTGGKLGHIWGLASPPLYAAAAYVAGAVALVRAYRPELRAAQVVQRVVETASGPPGRDPRLGWGVLDVRAAVTASLGGSVASGVSAAPFVPASGPGEPVVHRRLPGVLGVGGVLLAVVAIVSVGVVRRGRARGWRGG